MRGGGSVSITADGVKNYTQLFNQLYAIVDTDALTPNSKLVWDQGTTKLCFTIRNFSSSNIVFLCHSTTASSTTIDMLTISSSSTWHRCNLTTTISYTDRSTQIPPNNQDFIIYY